MSESLCTECLKKAISDYDAAPIDGSFEHPHPIFKLAQHNDNLKAEIEGLKSELKDARQQNGLIKIDLNHKNVLLESCESALRDRDILNEKLKAHLIETLATLKLIADLQESGGSIKSEIAANCIDQINGNEPYPLQKFRWQQLNLPHGITATMRIMEQQYSDNTWREIKVEGM